MPGVTHPKGVHVETTVRAPRPEKVAVVDEVRARLSAADAAILTEYRGLAVKDMETLRRSLTAVGGDYKVYKNTLVRRAAHEIGFEALESMLTGPTAIAFVEGDVAQVAKVLRDFARTNPSLVVKGGLLGTSLLDASSAAALADLPSREQLLAQIAGMLAAPMQKFASLLQALPSKFAYALSALIEERGGVEPEAVEAVVEAAEDALPAEGATPADAAEPAAESAEASPAEETTAEETTAEETTAEAVEAPVEEAAPVAAAPEAATPVAAAPEEATPVAAAPEEAGATESESEIAAEPEGSGESSD